MTKGYEQRKTSNKRYLATLDNISLRLPKGRKDVIRAHAETHGESVNAFINRAIDETLERDAVKARIGSGATPSTGSCDEYEINKGGLNHGDTSPD